MPAFMREAFYTTSIVIGRTGALGVVEKAYRVELA